MQAGRGGAHDIKAPGRAPRVRAKALRDQGTTTVRPDLRRKDHTLRLCASLVARKLELAKRVDLAEPWPLEPIEPCRSPVRNLP